MNIEEIKNKIKLFNDNTKIKVSNGEYLSGNFGSDRGDYENMYLSTSKDEKDIKTVLDFKNLIEKALKQKNMIGYKGGDFIIDDYTTVTIGEHGIGGLPITDIRQVNDIVYIIYSQIVYQEIWSEI